MVRTEGGAVTTEVSTTEYRAKLRHWHELAERGEDVIVTDHGVPAVRVTAAEKETVLDRMERDGLLRRAAPRRPSSGITSVTAAGDSASGISEGRER